MFVISIYFYGNIIILLLWNDDVVPSSQKRQTCFDSIDQTNPYLPPSFSPGKQPKCLGFGCTSMNSLPIFYVTHTHVLLKKRRRRRRRRWKPKRIKKTFMIKCKPTEESSTSTVYYVRTLPMLLCYAVDRSEPLRGNGTN